MPLTNTITPDEFLHIPSPSPSSLSSPETHVSQPSKKLIYFIPGNPGLISYYHEFLSLLVTDLPAWTVYGASLGGFEIGGGRGSGLLDDEWGQGPWGLTQQIYIVKGRLGNLVGEVRGEGDVGGGLRGERVDGGGGGETIGGEEEGEGKVQVVIIAHSVGAYIAMEIVREYQHEKRASRASGYDIDMAILLTPTVTHIASSPMGRMLAPVLGYVPFAPEIAQSCVRGLTAMLPRGSFAATMGKLMGQPPEPALNTTVDWLRSHSGVRQALFMARDEMRDIAEDRWEEDVWQTSNQGERGTRVKLVFYFAEEDHWVNGSIRDSLISSKTRDSRPVDVIEEHEGEVVRNQSDDDEKSRERASMRDPGPTFMVEEKGALVHGFCIRHSGFVAKKVISWMGERYGEK